jgi:hypothetical protein
MLLCKLNVAIHLQGTVTPNPLAVAITPTNVGSVGNARLTGWMLAEITKTYFLMQIVQYMSLCTVHLHHQNVTLTI